MQLGICSYFPLLLYSRESYSGRLYGVRHRLLELKPLSHSTSTHTPILGAEYNKETDFPSASSLSPPPSHPHPLHPSKKMIVRYLAHYIPTLGI